ncbi:ribonuclease H-like domain-containing protein [Xylariaceae sp. FL1272]|nr:ribonuclease H-like domain-containing protein [Xylariaceae sp. FL1272]
MSSAVDISRPGSNGADVSGGEIERPPQWPLSFQIQKPMYSYEMYRGPAGQTSELIYCSSKDETEKLASRFLREKVVGFGVEWVNWYGPPPEDERLQDRVSLIQVACEERIGLFHIAAHTGDKPEDFLAPSLRKLIESPSIIKATSGIMRDFERLETNFRDLGLKPRGGVDLSYLHNLVTYGAGGSDQWKKCTTKPFNFLKQIETHLGLPFEKEATDWSEKYLTKKQQACAASDAYAGLMLYHCLEAKRVAMVKKPPQLLNAELYPWFKYERGVNTQILLVVEKKIDRDTEMITVITAKDHLRDAHDKKLQKVFRRSGEDAGAGGDRQQETQVDDLGAGDAVGEQLPETGPDTIALEEENKQGPGSLQPMPAPTTPPRPPPLTTGLTVTMEKTSFSGFGTEAEPLTLADSSDEDCKPEISDETLVLLSTPSKPQKRKRSEQQPENPRPGRVQASDYWASKREEEG